MRRQELQKMKKLAGLLKEELDISWNPFQNIFNYDTIESIMVKEIKGFLKRANLDPNRKYSTYTNNQNPEDILKTVEETVEEFINKIKALYPSATTWVSSINDDIRDKWVSEYNSEHAVDQNGNYLEGEAAWNDFGEENEAIHDNDELVNRIVRDNIITHMNGITIYNITNRGNERVGYRISTNPKDLTEELDVSWNPYEYNYEYQSTQLLIAKKAKEYFKEAGLDPDGKYEIYRRFKRSTYTPSSPKDFKTIDEAAKEFIDEIKKIYSEIDEWVSDINSGIEHDWISDRQRHPDDEVDMDDYDEESEEVHNKEELANQAVFNGFKSSHIPNKGVIITNSSAYWDRNRFTIQISAIPEEVPEEVTEDLDVSWNPYSEEQQEHCLLATKCVDSNIEQNLYMNHGEINNPETNKKEIQRLLWPEAKKIKGDGYDMYYYFNDIIDTWLFILDLSPKSSNYEKAVETITSPGGVMFSSGSDQLLELCKQMIITLNPILDKEVFKWR